MTVQELIATKKSSTKVWMCPNEVRDSGFNRDYTLQGIDCTIGTIPEVLLDKEVAKTFSENGTFCIIWKNI